MPTCTVTNYKYSITKLSIHGYANNNAYYKYDIRYPCVCKCCLRMWVCLFQLRMHLCYFSLFMIFMYVCIIMIASLPYILYSILFIKIMIWMARISIRAWPYICIIYLYKWIHSNSNKYFLEENCVRALKNTINRNENCNVTG